MDSEGSSQTYVEAKIINKKLRERKKEREREKEKHREKTPNWTGLRQLYWQFSFYNLYRPFHCTEYFIGVHDIAQELD